MNPKQQTAVVSTLLNVLLTVFKFILFGLTGSLAVLAEAWHSLTDIITSLLVFFSVGRPSPPPRDGKKGFSGWEWLPLETRISFFIGLFILAAGALVVRKIVDSPPVSIASPLVPGLCFLVFAIGSYYVYRFETRVGKKLNSPALIADGLHSKADMVGSLLAGFSLLLHLVGVNLDKPVAVVISLFILSFAFDTFINFFRALRGADSWDERATLGVVERLLDRRTWRRLLESQTGLGGWLTAARLRCLRRSAFWLVVILLALLVSASCLFTVGPSEKAFRERLGKVLDRPAPLGPGLYWKLPFPLERVIRVETEKIRAINVGNISTPKTVALLWTLQHGSEQAFLSGDNNFFYPYYVIHYRVKDPYLYVFGCEQPEDCLDCLAHARITSIFSRRNFYDIATYGRRQIEEVLARDLQADVDRLGLGLEIVAVNTKDIHPPISIAGAFEEVIAALQEKEQSVNQALGYRNGIVPEARGAAARTLRGAEGYVKSKVERATGDAEKFLLLSRAVSGSRELSERILYLQAMREALAGKKLVLVSPQAGRPDLWLGRARPYQLYTPNLETEAR